MIVLGLIGSPAGGKSTIARELAARGATWIDADRIAREVLQRDEVQAQLIDHFGAEITGADGRIDRRRMADAVFGADDSNRLALTYLESVVHPPTRSEIHQRLRQAAVAGSPVAVLDVPLLIESGWDLSCDEVWCVDAPLDVRVARAAGRGWDAAELRRREANQIPLGEKRRRSNRCFDNRGSRANLIEQLEPPYRELVRAAQRLPGNPGHCVTD